MPVSIASIGEYDVEKELGEGAYLAREKGGTRVVLKMLGADCLLKGQLHPMIRDRLGRVRELAHFGVANLRGAEREGEKAFLVWEFVEGRTLEEVLREGKNRDELEKIAREITAHVEGLHGLGIVHGAIHTRNVIVMGDGRVKLTHVSPLLYHEEVVDREAMKKLFGQMGIELAEKKVVDQVAQEDAGLRKWALIGAIVAALIGAAVAWWIWKNATSEPRETARASDYSCPCHPVYSLETQTPPHPNPLPRVRGRGDKSRGGEL